MKLFSLFKGKNQITPLEHLDAWILRGETHLPKNASSPASPAAAPEPPLCTAWYSDTDSPEAIVFIPSPVPEGADERARRLIAEIAAPMHRQGFFAHAGVFNAFADYDSRLSSLTTPAGIRILAQPLLAESLMSLLTEKDVVKTLAGNTTGSANTPPSPGFSIEGYSPPASAWFFVPPTVHQGKSPGDVRIHSYAAGSFEEGHGPELSRTVGVTVGTGTLRIRYFFTLPSRAATEESVRIAFGKFTDSVVAGFLSGLAAYWRQFFENALVAEATDGPFRPMGTLDCSLVFTGAVIPFRVEISESSEKVLVAAAATLGLKSVPGTPDFHALFNLFSLAFSSLMQDSVLGLKLVPFLTRMPGTLPAPFVPLLNLLALGDRTLIIQNCLVGALGARGLPFLFRDRNAEGTFSRTVPALDSDITYALADVNAEDFAYAAGNPSEGTLSRAETEILAARAVLAALRNGGFDVSGASRKAIERALAKPLEDLDELTFRNLSKENLWFPLVTGLGKAMMMYVLSQVSDRDLAAALLGEEEREQAIVPFLSKARRKAVDDELEAVKTRLKEGTLPWESISDLKRGAAEKMSAAIEKRNRETGETSRPGGKR